MVKADNVFLINEFSGIVITKKTNKRKVVKQVIKTQGFTVDLITAKVRLYYAKKRYRDNPDTRLFYIIKSMEKEIALAERLIEK